MKNLPSKESIKFAEESALRISNIKILSPLSFQNNSSKEISMNIDENFITSLENGEHLNKDFLSIK